MVENPFAFMNEHRIGPGRSWSAHTHEYLAGVFQIEAALALVITSR